MSTIALRPITTLGSLRVLRAMAELTKTEAREARSPEVALEALDDTIDALSEAIAVLEQHRDVIAPLTPVHGITPHPDPIVELRAQGARRRAAVATCACDLWPLTDLEGTVDDGITAHGYDACVSHGEVIATRVHNHGPEDGPGLACVESSRTGRLRGECMDVAARLTVGAV